MSIAEEQKSVDSVAADLASIGSALAESRELRRLVESPVVREGKKLAIFKELWGSRVGPVTMAFVSLLATKGRESVLPEVIGEYQALRDVAQGVETADVQTAVPLTVEQEAALVKRLEAYTEKKIRMRSSTNPEIRGGMVVRIGDTVLDGSVRRQLERLRERFLEGGDTHA
jgi:F-type H+-transporting ATPase subunit delta